MFVYWHLPLIQINSQHLPVESSGVEDELGELGGMIHKDTFRHEVTDTLQTQTQRKREDRESSG